MHLDHTLEQALPARHAGGPAAVLRAVAAAVVVVANPRLAVPVTVLVGAVVSRRSGSREQVRLALAAAAGLVVTVLPGKVLLGRAGPPGSDVHQSLGYFPSGHTTTALVCAGVLAALLSAARPDLRQRAAGAAAGWTLLVAAALVWNRDHWLSDVAAGLLLGALLLELLLRWPLRLAPSAAARVSRG